jgi:Zn finger protein HypA/HybF involved in hydrogenase expression
MKLLLTKCAICDYWHNPIVHNGHCPHCGSFPLKIAKRTTRYYCLEGMRLIEVVRSIPRGFEQSISAQ